MSFPSRTLPPDTPFPSDRQPGRIAATAPGEPVLFGWRAARAVNLRRGIVLLAGLILFARCPDVLLRPSFWSEDGWAWWPEAYRDGVWTLFQQHSGYLQTVSRLVGQFAAWLPLTWGPAIFAVAAFLIQWSVVWLLMSPRLDRLWPDLRGRGAFALFYAALPNSFEPYVNLTNSQWFLAILMFLVLATKPPRDRFERVVDGTILIVGGLSGPFVAFLLPVAALFRLRDRRDALLARTSLRRFSILFATFLAQAVTYAHNYNTGRGLYPLGATLGRFTRIVSQQIVFGAMAGSASMGWLNGLPSWQDGVLPAAICAVAIVLALLALLRGSTLFRFFCVFAGVGFAATLCAAVVAPGAFQWQLMTIPHAGDRYYLFPMLGWLGVLFTFAADRIALLRIVGIGGLLLILLWGIPADWRQNEIPHLDFHAQARRFDRAAKGTAVVLPIRTGGGLSSMTITR